MPCYVFGGTDFFENLSTHGGIISNISRKLKMGMTIFWGHFGLPIPYTPKVTMCIAEPIEVKQYKGEGKIPQDMIDELHSKVRILTSFLALYDHELTLICFIVCRINARAV